MNNSEISDDFDFMNSTNKIGDDQKSKKQEEDQNESIIDEFEEN